MYCRYCGSELKDDENICTNCWQPVEGEPVKQPTPVKTCKKCGATLKEGATFCGKCGEPVSVNNAPKATAVSVQPSTTQSIPQSPPVNICKKCGTALKEGAGFCGKCGEPTRPSTPILDTKPSCPSTPIQDVKPTRISTPINEPKPQTAEKSRPAFVEAVSQTVSDRIVDKDRFKRILCIVLVIGICMTAFGLVGQAMFSYMASSIKNEITKSSSGDDFLVQAILNATSSTAIDLVVGIIKNDATAINKVIKSIGSLVDDEYGIASLFGSFIGPELISEGRKMLQKESGALWPLLLVMVYYKEVLTIGVIAAGGGAVLLYLLGFRKKDLDLLKRTPLYIAGIIGVGLSIIALIVQMFV